MKTPTLLVQICAAAALAAPLAVLGSMNDDTVSELKLTKFVEPLFPAFVRYEGIPEGVVTLAVSRTAAGEPADILVLNSSHPGFTNAAVRAVKQWRFAPATSPEQLASRIVRVGFKLEGVVIMAPFAIDQLNQARADRRDWLTAPVKIPSVDASSGSAASRNQPMPAYPAALAGKGQEGRVAVKFYVDQDGKVRLPEIIEATDPEFAAAALNAVSQWRYAPPRIAGRSVVACDKWEFKFQAAN